MIILTCGVVRVVVLLIVSSICCVWTSNVSNWCSNLSIKAEIYKDIVRSKMYSEKMLSEHQVTMVIVYVFTFSRFILLNVASIDLTTPAMDFVTYLELKKNDLVTWKFCNLLNILFIYQLRKLVYYFLNSNTTICI